MNGLLKRVPALMVLVLCGTVAGFAAAELPSGMTALEDSDMASVTGREGIALDLELRINAESVGGIEQRL